MYHYFFPEAPMISDHPKGNDVCVVCVCGSVEGVVVEGWVVNALWEVVGEVGGSVKRRDFVGVVDAGPRLLCGVLEPRPPVSSTFGFS